MQHGLAPDGSHYYPTFPYGSYAHLNRDDVLSIKKYIFKQKTIKQTNKPHQLKWYLSRLSIGFWKIGNEALEETLDTAELKRGSYLINNLGHCGECHTPRSGIGQLDYARHLQGNDEIESPNISNTEQGIKDWSNEELTELFEEGLLPDGDYAAGHMAEVIEYSTAFWSNTDLKAAIAYLRLQH